MVATAHPLNPQMLELKRILSSPIDFARTLTIMDKRAKLIRLNHNRMQRHFFGSYSYGKRPTDIILKFRQGGATTAIIGEISRACWTTPTRALSLMNVDKNTANMREMGKRMFDSWPMAIDAGGLQISKPQRKADNATTTRYDNGSRWVMDTAASPDAARGSTVDIVHLSECAFYTHADDIIAGAMQAAGSARWKIWESTPNGAQGKFYELCMKALDGDKDYRLHFYPWWWADEYALAVDVDMPVIPTRDELQLIEAHGLTLEQINWRRLKQRELGMMFAQEYPESINACFLLSGGGFFGDVSKFFSAPKDATHNPEYRYVGGIDWGQSADYTVLSIGCVDTGEMVYRYRVNRMEYDDMITEIVRLCAVWGVENLIPERNSMSMQVSALRGAIEASGLPTHMQPFTTTNDSKRKGIMSLHSALHSGALRLIPDEVVRAEYLAFESKQTATGAYTYQAAGDGHDDCIIADMLMWRAMNAAPVGVY